MIRNIDLINIIIININMIRNCIRKSPSLIKQSSNICYQTKLNNFRENRSYGKEKRIESIQKFYDSTRANPYKILYKNKNIDSHDNSMYHKSLTNMKCKSDFEVCICILNEYKSNICPYVKDSKMIPLNIKTLVEDFNHKCKTNMIMTQYFENF